MTATPARRVVLIDDHELARRGLRAMLETVDWLEVVGEAADCATGLDAVGELRPAIVLLDVRMPGLDGLACLERLKALDPSVAVVIVTLYDDPGYVLEGIRRGAAGFLQKDATTGQILDMLGRVLDGQLAIDPELLRTAIAGREEPGAGAGAPAAGTGRPASTETADYRLTPREREVLRLVADGLTNKEIGGRLRISEDTAKKHVQNVIWKLRAVDRTQAAILAYRLGLIDFVDGEAGPKAGGGPRIGG